MSEEGAGDREPAPHHVAPRGASPAAQLADALSETRDRLSNTEDPLTLLAGFFAYAPVGLQIYDATGRSILTNRAFRDLFGAEPPPEYNVLQDEIAAREGVLDLIHRAFAGETVRLPPVWYDPRELTQVTVEHGRRVAIEATSFPLFDRDSQVTHVAIVFKDLTAELLLRERTEQERDLLQRLIGVMGHDLRTPLTAIAGTAAVLLRKAEAPEWLPPGLRRVADSARRMNRMIGDILDFSRIRATGGLPVHPESVDLARVCHASLDELRAAHPDRDLRLEADPDVAGEWDPDRLTQVIANLVSNALTHGAPDSPVDVSILDRGPDVALRVHNQGHPIPEAERQDLFEPFRRGRDVRAREPVGGLGLGLFIVQQIACAHGGRVDIDSSVERGTTFEVVLPRRPT